MSTRAIITQDEPFQASMNNLPGQAGGFANFSIAIPAGKKLVVRSASVRVRVPPGQSVTASITTNGPPGSGFGSQYLELTRQGTFDGADVYVGSGSMLLWVGSGGATFSVVRSSTAGLIGAEVAVVGYLET